jgi:hypothetical protein
MISEATVALPLLKKQEEFLRRYSHWQTEFIMCPILSAVSVMGPGELGLTVFVTFESFGLDSIEWYESD